MYISIDNKIFFNLYNMKKKTKNKTSNKYLRLFNKYSKTEHLTEKQIKNL